MFLPVRTNPSIATGTFTLQRLIKQYCTVVALFEKNGNSLKMTHPIVVKTVAV